MEWNLSSFARTVRRVPQPAGAAVATASADARSQHRPARDESCGPWRDGPDDRGIERGGGELLAAAIGAGDTKGECAGIGVSGECVMSRPLEGVTVHFAGRSFGPKTVQVVAALDHGKGIDEGGLLGADVLRECVLAFPQSRRAGVIAHCPGAAASAPAPGPTAGVPLPHVHGKRALLPRSPRSR